MYKILAFIPARGGSKGIPRKNIKNFNKKPLIQWTIEQAKESKLINEIIVSSDSKKILSISKNLGASTILRPKNLSTDSSSTESAIIHCIQNLKKKIDIIVLLSPCSPLRKKEDIDNMINFFIKKKLDSCFSASKLNDFLIWRYDERIKKMKSFNYNFKKRLSRQKRNILEYVENGSIYIFKSNEFEKLNNRIFNKHDIYQMDFWQSFELDEKKDWKLLETLHKVYILKNSQ